MPEATISEWKSFVELCPHSHLLQMGEWGELKSTFGWEAVRLIQGNIGAQILFRDLPFGFRIAYIPKGPIRHSGASSVDSDFLQEVDAVCNRHRAVFCKIEPDEWETQREKPANDPAVAVSKYNIQPPRTIVVDLSGDEEEILGRMKQKTRYNIGLAEKKNVSVRQWDDLAGFHKLAQITGGRDGFGVHSQEYYRRAYDLFHPAGLCELLVAEYSSTPLAALMVFVHGIRAWYLYGASSDEERNRMPTYLLQWEAMRWARSRGCKDYDLWGVPDENEEALEECFENRHDGLWGVYRFKRGFGGELRRAVQAQDRIYKKMLYQLYLWRMAGREVV